MRLGLVAAMQRVFGVVLEGGVLLLEALGQGLLVLLEGMR